MARPVRKSDRGCSDRDLAALADGYGFGEIDPSRKQAFELHLLECDSCRETVILAQDLRDGFREGVPEEATSLAQRRFPRLAWASAAAVLLVLVLLPLWPERPPAVVLAESHRAEQDVPVLPAGYAQVELLIPRDSWPGRAVTDLSWDVTAAPDWDTVTGVVRPLASDDPRYFHLLLEVATLPAGGYALVGRLAAGGESIVESFPFTVPGG